jgi:hypothetical protein
MITYLIMILSCPPEGDSSLRKKNVHGECFCERTTFGDYIIPILFLATLSVCICLICFSQKSVSIAVRLVHIFAVIVLRGFHLMSRRSVWSVITLQLTVLRTQTVKKEIA